MGKGKESIFLKIIKHIFFSLTVFFCFQSTQNIFIIQLIKSLFRLPAYHQIRIQITGMHGIKSLKFLHNPTFFQCFFHLFLFSGKGVVHMMHRFFCQSRRDSKGHTAKRNQRQKRNHCQGTIFQKNTLLKLA